MKKSILRNLVVAALLLGLLFAAMPTQQAQAADLTITSLAEFEAFRDAVNAGDNFAGSTVTLATDIDLANVTWVPIGTSSKTFAGIFDGGNYTISNVTVYTPNVDQVGLFGATNGTIKNLNLNNVYIAGNQFVGGLVGYSYPNPTITNVHVTNVTVDANHWAGGLVGWGYGQYSNCSVTNPTITLVYDTVAQDNGDKAGGLLGFLGEDGVVRNSVVTNVNITGVRDVGGLIGNITTRTRLWNNTVNGGTVTASNATHTHSSPYAGGLVGRAAGTNNIIYAPIVNDVTVTSYDPAFAGPVFGGPAGNVILNYVHNVTTDAWYTTISEAITASVDNDVIEVYPGTYYENVYTGDARRVNGLTVRGIADANGNYPVVRGSMKFGRDRSFGGDYYHKNLVLENFRIEANLTDTALYGTTRHALWVENFENAQLRNLTLAGTESALFDITYGISVGGRAKNYTIDNVTIDNFLIGVYGRALNMTIQNSDISRVQAGVNIMGGGNLVITDSSIVTEVTTTEKQLYAVRFGSGDTPATPDVLDFHVSNSTLALNNPNGLVPSTGNYMRSIVLRGNAGGELVVANSNIPQGVLNISSIPVEVSTNWWGSTDKPTADVNYVGLVTFCGWLDAPAPDGQVLGLVTNQTKGTTHCSIKDAVNNSTDGDVIQVGAGTYDEEDILINKSIQLLGAPDHASIIAPSGATNNSTIKVVNPSGDVLIDGFTFNNPPRPSHGATVLTSGTTIALDSATVTVSNNIINGADRGQYNDYGLYGQGNHAAVIWEHNTLNLVGGNPLIFEQQLGSTTVRNNTVYTGDVADGSLYYSMIYGDETVTTPQIVENNTFSFVRTGGGWSEAITFNTVPTYQWSGSTKYGHYTDIQIRNNTIILGGPSDRGIGIADRSAGDRKGTITGAVIEGNTITGQEEHVNENTVGIMLRGDVQGTQIGDNTFTTLATGVRIIEQNFDAPTPGPIPSGTVIEDNTFNLSVGVAVNSDSPDPVDASPNYWGSADGPSTADLVGLVDYIPYWINPEMTELNAASAKNVTQDKLYWDLQLALSEANPDDEIEIFPGTYTGHLTIDKALTIYGPGENSAFGASPATIQGLVSIEADGVTISDLKIIPGSVGGNKGGIYVAASNATLNRNLIDGMNGNGTGTIKGIHVYSATATGISNITIDHNVVRNINNTGKGSDGIMIQGVVDTVTISNNTVEAIYSGGWAYGIEVTPTGSAPNNPPQNVTITGNTVRNINSTGQPGVSLSIDAYDADHPANASEVVVHGNKFLDSPYAIVNKDAAHQLDATANFFGLGIEPGDVIFGNVDWTPFYGDEGMLNLVDETTLDIATITTNACGTATEVEIAVNIGPVSYTSSYQMNFQFDPEKVEIVDAYNGNVFTGDLMEEEDLGNGLYVYGNTTIGSGGNFSYINDPDGGVLMYLKVKLLSPGTSTITLLGTSYLTIGDDVIVDHPYDLTEDEAIVDVGDPVISIGTNLYCDLQSAVTAAQANDTLTVLRDFTVPEAVEINKAITFDTATYTVTRTNAGAVADPFSDYDSLFKVVTGGNLTIKGSGTLDAQNDAHTKGAALRIVGGQVTLTDTVTLKGDYVSVRVEGNIAPGAGNPEIPAVFNMTGGTVADGIVVVGNGGELNLSAGLVTSERNYAPITGNGRGVNDPERNYSGTEINISGTARVERADDIAIYHPQDGVLNISGGTITAHSPIHMKAGDINVSGGVITANGEYADPSENTSGGNPTGDAIFLISQDGYTGELNVSITGGTITSANGHAIQEYVLSGPTKLVKAIISDGELSGNKAAVKFATNTDDALDLIGGAYSTDPKAFVYAPKYSYLDTDGWYRIGDMVGPVVGTVSMQARTVRAGVPVTLTGAVGGTHTATSTEVYGPNVSFALLAPDTYTITTAQPRYLNIYANLGKTKTINGTNLVIAPLRLIAGNAVMTLDANGYDVINHLDAGNIGTHFMETGDDISADVNFDGIVNIRDLALVGGNYGLTNETAYTDWIP